MIEILYKENDKWINMLSVLGCPAEDRQDLVHDMYIRIYTMENPRKIMYNETEVNHFYIYKTIRSIYYQYRRDNNKSPDLIDNDDDFYFELADDYDDVMETELGWEKMYSKLIKGVNSFGTYGSNLVHSYFRTDKSMRDIANETTISLTSIFNSIRKYREVLKAEYGEDWIDFLNEDYDKI